MRIRNHNTMDEMLQFIREFYNEREQMPTTYDLADRFGYSRGTAYNYLVAMNAAGMLKYQDGVIELSDSKSTFDRETVNLVGSIACGTPVTESENIELTTKLPTAIFGKGPFFMLHAQGDSMEDEGISEGDLLLIRQQTAAQVGDIIVALDDKNQNTLKRYGGIDKENGCAILEYCNQAVYGNKTICVPSLVCQGVLSHIIKER